MTNPVDRCHAAVAVLAADGHIKQRLIRAYQEHLADLDEDDLPISLKEPFADLRQRLHAVAPSNGEGPICASVRKMSVSEAGASASSIVDLYRDLIRQADPFVEKPPAAVEDDVMVPPFLVKSV